MKWRFLAIINIAFFQYFAFQSLSVIGAWHAIASRVRWDSPAAAKAAYRNASFIAGNRVIFNIKGNDYRLVAAMQKHIKMPDVDPVSLLLHVMDARSLTRKDMEPNIGSRARVAEVLNRVRPLSLEMIRRLSTGLDLPADLLIAGHELRRAA